MQITTRQLDKLGFNRRDQRKAIAAGGAIWLGVAIADKCYDVTHYAGLWYATPHDYHRQHKMLPSEKLRAYAGAMPTEGNAKALAKTMAAMPITQAVMGCGNVMLVLGVIDGRLTPSIQSQRSNVQNQRYSY